jgi:hypothetical protein
VTPGEALDRFRVALNVEGGALDAYRSALTDEIRAVTILADPGATDAARRSARYRLAAARERCEVTRRRLVVSNLHAPVERAADDVLAVVR